MSYNLCKTGPQIDEVLQGYSALVAAATTATNKANEATSIVNEFRDEVTDAEQRIADSTARAEEIEQALEDAIVLNPGSIVVDKTLAIEGAAADAKATGEAIAEETSTREADITSLKQDTLTMGGNPNLLRNGYFQVNQRNAKSGAYTWQYCFDGWKALGNNVTISGNTIKDALIVQPIDTDFLNDIKNETLTISIEADGQIYTATATASSDGTYSVPNVDGSGISVLCPATGYDVGNVVAIQENATGKTISVVKLEKGNKSTLAPSSQYKPNVELEKLKCQRYYQRHKNISVLFASNTQNASYYSSAFEFPAMRTTPSVSFLADESGNKGIVQGIAIINSANESVWLSLADLDEKNFDFRVTESNAQGRAMQLYDVELSADL